MDATIEKAPPTPAVEPAGAAGGPERAPARRPGVRGDGTSASTSTFTSVWAPVLGKAAGILAGMLALAGIGAASIATGTGVPVPVAAAAPSTRASQVPSVVPAHSSSPPAVSAGAGRSAPAAVPGSSATASQGAPGITADGKVILNHATVVELTRLPKVGMKRAEAIVLLRTRLGKFKKPTDLLRVKGIGKKTLDGMLPLLVVDPPREAADRPATQAGR